MVATVLTRVYSYKYLGITLTHNLSWSPHIKNCCNKTRRLLGLFYRRFHQHSTSSTMIQLYRSHIHLHLEYSSTVWNPGLKGDIDALEDVQKFALRMCTKSWNFNYEELLTNANLPSLRTRRVQASLSYFQSCKRSY